MGRKKSVFLSSELAAEKLEVLEYFYSKISAINEQLVSANTSKAVSETTSEISSLVEEGLENDSFKEYFADIEENIKSMQIGDGNRQQLSESLNRALKNLSVLITAYRKYL